MEFLGREEEEEDGDQPERDESKLEKDHVHQVYEVIANHFSNTRYKPWPIVEKFIMGLPVGSVGVDIGCGNGKNMRIRRDGIKTMGLDMSLELLKICQGNEEYEAIHGTMLSLPFKSSSMDFCICIAALHHLSSPERRQQALLEMWRTLKVGGVLLIFVWALEQPPSSSLYRHKLRYLSEQDVLVPWTSRAPDGEESQHLRYYHLYRKGELEESILSSSSFGSWENVYNGYDRDNWYICVRKTS